jgi:flagellar biosynthetic protein FliP
MRLARLALLATALCAFCAFVPNAAAQDASATPEDGHPAPAVAPVAPPVVAPQPPPRPPSLLDQFFPIRVETAQKDDAAPNRDLSNAVEIVLLLTFLTLLPPLLLTVTCFSRVVIVLSFVRRAMSTPELPPNPVLIGLALFVTGAVMAPTGRAIHQQAIEPYLEGKLAFAPAAQKASVELERFLLQHARAADVALFMDLTKTQPVEGPEQIPLVVAVPAFVVSELRTAFQMGFVLYLPFLVIDLVVSSVLLAMGMYMLPPMLVATPLKILLFVLVDGWGLVVQQVWRGLT